eukprot:1161223-Pyramimonas_sp.AAC.1
MPFIAKVTPILAVPWGPHCALQMRLRSSGHQLLCRELVLPARLPQVPRPGVQPTPGSTAGRHRQQRL